MGTYPQELWDLADLTPLNHTVLNGVFPFETTAASSVNFSLVHINKCALFFKKGCRNAPKFNHDDLQCNLSLVHRVMMKAAYTSPIGPSAFNSVTGLINGCPTFL